MEYLLLRKSDLTERIKNQILYLRYFLGQGDYAILLLAFFFPTPTNLLPVSMIRTDSF